MKNFKNNKLRFCFTISLLFMIGLISCNDDSEVKNNVDEEIIGVWLRSDSTDTFEHKMTFDTDNTGLDYFKDGSYENYTDFTWSIDKEYLTMTSTDENEEFIVKFKIEADKLTLYLDDNNLVYYQKI